MKFDLLYIIIGIFLVYLLFYKRKKLFIRLSKLKKEILNNDKEKINTYLDLIRNNKDLIKAKQKYFIIYFVVIIFIIVFILINIFGIYYEEYIYLYIVLLFLFLNISVLISKKVFFNRNIEYIFNFNSLIMRDIIEKNDYSYFPNGNLDVFDFTEKKSIYSNISKFYSGNTIQTTWKNQIIELGDIKLWQTINSISTDDKLRKRNIVIYNGKIGIAYLNKPVSFNLFLQKESLFKIKKNSSNCYDDNLFKGHEIKTDSINIVSTIFDVNIVELINRFENKYDVFFELMISDNQIKCYINTNGFTCANPFSAKQEALNIIITEKMFEDYKNIVINLLNNIEKI